MVWCTCPIRCKGGREVAPRTRSKHERELQIHEDQQLIQRCFPGQFTSLSDVPRRRRRRSNDDDATQGPRNKRVRGGGEPETQPVRESTNFCRLKSTSQAACSRRRAANRRHVKWQWTRSGHYVHIYIVSVPFADMTRVGIVPHDIVPPPNEPPGEHRPDEHEPPPDEPPPVRPRA